LAGLEGGSAAYFYVHAMGMGRGSCQQKSSAEEEWLYAMFLPRYATFRLISLVAGVFQAEISDPQWLI